MRIASPHGPSVTLTLAVYLLLTAQACKRSIPQLETSCNTDSDCTTVVVSDDDCCPGCVRTIANKQTSEARAAMCKAHTMTKPCATPTCGWMPSLPPKCVAKECVPSN